MYLIVGIDPGTTAGIAALDLEGNLVDVFSSKDFGIDRVVEHLITVGKPSIISTDVNPAPEFVKKLAARLQCPVFIPEESLAVSEKISLTRKYKTEDSHQRDALSAALVTFNKFKNKFRKIESLNYGEDVKDLVLQGISIDDAVKKLKPDEKPKVERIKKEVKPVLSKEERAIRKLEKQNSVLKEEILQRGKEIEDLREEIGRVRGRFRIRLKKEPEIRKRDRIIEDLREEIKVLGDRLGNMKKLRNLWDSVAKGKIKPVGIFPERYGGRTWIRRKLKERDKKAIRGIEIAFLHNPEDMKYLKERGIRIASDNYVREIEDLAYISVEDMGKALEKDISLEGIVEEYRRGRTAK